MSKIIDSFFNFTLRLVEMFRSNVISKIAFIIFGTGVSFVGVSSISLFAGYADADKAMIASVKNGDSSDTVFYIGLFLMVIGFVMLMHQYSILFSKRVVLYFGNSLELGDSDAPKKAMSKKDKLNADLEHFLIINSYNRQEVLEDYKYNVKSFKNRSRHKNISKIYLAALGSTPYLYLIGTLVRNGHIESVVLDYEREKGKWYSLVPFGEKAFNLLADEFDKLSIDEKIDQLCDSDSKDIGIALAYTFEIDKNSVPQQLQENTLYLKSSLGYGRDKLTNMQSQVALLDELALYIDKLKMANKNIHLFISAQASFCINLGKRYQDNTMGAIHLHNFNGDSRECDWSITFNKGEVQ